jgi:hypothetical protein
MRIRRKPPILSVMSQPRSIVAGGTATVLLLGVGTSILFAEPPRTNGEIGGPVIVTAAPETDPPPSASPASPDETAATAATAATDETDETDETTPPRAVLSAPPARPVAPLAASAAPSARPGGDVGPLAASVAAPTPSVDHTASGRTVPDGESAGDPAISSSESGRALAPVPDPTASAVPTSSVDAARWWRTVSPDRWGGARTASAAGPPGTREPRPVVIPTPRSDGADWSSR